MAVCANPVHLMDCHEIILLKYLVQYNMKAGFKGCEYGKEPAPLIE